MPPPVDLRFLGASSPLSAGLAGVCEEDQAGREHISKRPVRSHTWRRGDGTQPDGARLLLGGGLHLGGLLLSGGLLSGGVGGFLARLLEEVDNAGDLRNEAHTVTA